MTQTIELPPLEVASRLERIRSRLSDVGIDALVVSTLANVRYLTGFTGSAGVLVVTANDVLLTTDGRYRTQSAEQVAAVGAADVVRIEIGDAQTQRQAVRTVLDSPAIATTGLEADNVTWSGERRWRDLLEGTSELVPTSGVVEALREVKDAGELARMARAAAIADSALQEVVPMLSLKGAKSVTESEFALALDTAMRRGGAQDRAFDTIVAAGPNSAKPHHQPTDRQIMRKDAVVVDFGATFDGYRSDMTRTFCIGGEPVGDLARIFEVVQKSQAQGVAAVAPGKTAKDIDQVCRNVIAEAGWAERFEHGTGHGVGLDIHEAPTVSQQGTGILAPGIVVTVEPGVYIPGIGGVRIEDTLVVTVDGSRPLTMFTKDVAA